MNKNTDLNESPVLDSKPPFGIKDKIGYMSGDLANNLTFQFASMFLMVFYTEVWGISPGVVGTLFAVSRIVDAFTDVGMGVLVDKVPARKDGKFRPWIKWVMGPIAIASFLMYQTGLADASMTVKIVYMYATYIIWGSLTYTAINILTDQWHQHLRLIRMNVQNYRFGVREVKFLVKCLLVF